MNYLLTPQDLKQARKVAGKSTREMALFAGKGTRKTIENWEHGAGHPQYNVLVTMLQKAGYDFAKVIQLLSTRKDDTHSLNWFAAFATEEGDLC